MIAWWWSWLLAGVGVTGLWLAGSHKRAGWMIGLSVQLLWITYAVASGQPGFVVSAFAYGAVNARNMIKWKREQTERTGA